MSSGWLGLHHAALLDSAGSVWTIGKGIWGQLGHGTQEHLSTIQRVEGLPPCSVVSAGDEFTACVSVDGQVYCFGCGTEGQLGHGIWGNYTKLTSPHQVMGLPPIRSLQCGSFNVACVDDDSCVWTFGRNGCGQLGLGHTTTVTTPNRVEGLRARQVACGGSHMLALTTDGQLYGFGDGSRGQLGHESKSSFLSPTHIPVPFEPHSVHCADSFSVIRDTEGHLWSTGQNHIGQLGLGDPNDRCQFTQIPGIVSTQAACGWNHVIAIDQQQRLWGWGNNHYGQLSPLTAQNESTPTILREDTVTALVGQFQTLALTTDDQVIACGRNEHSQLGNCGARHDKSHWTPTQFTPEMMQAAQMFTSRAKSARKILRMSS